MHDIQIRADSQVEPSTRSSGAQIHWPEAFMEALGLGIFMLAAGAFGTCLEHPASRLQQAIPSPFVRRAVMGALMGLTAIGLVYSPWGKRSGAHLNPAVTLTFLRLGRVRARDALAYILAQFLGGVAGVMVVIFCGSPNAAPPATANAPQPRAA
jgi:aquaporin Z